MAFVSNAGTLEDLKMECGNPATFPRESQLLFGGFDGEGYEGSYYLLWRGDDGKLYDMADSHCSCNGFSDNLEAWNRLTPVTPEYLRQRAAPYYGYVNGTEQAKRNAEWKALTDSL